MRSRRNCSEPEQVPMEIMESALSSMVGLALPRIVPAAALNLKAKLPPARDPMVKRRGEGVGDALRYRGFAVEASAPR